MEKTQDFYVTLPSNVKSNFYENTVAKYKTKLANRIILNGDWEVGLSSISYTKSWKYKSEMAIIYIKYYEYMQLRVLSHHVEIDLKDYSTMDELIIGINQKLIQIEQEMGYLTPKFTLDKKSGLININIPWDHGSLILPNISDNLCKLLGINKRKLDAHIDRIYDNYLSEFYRQPLYIQANGGINWRPNPPSVELMNYSGEEPYDMYGSYKALYLYTDIIEYSHIGNDYGQLLRIVEIPIKSKYNEQIYKKYSNIQYKKLIKNEFDTIEIIFKDEIDNVIKFESGRSYVTLHFRRIDYKRTI